VENICDLSVFIGMEEDCKAIVFQNLPMVIDLIVELLLTPEQVCNTVGFCTAADDAAASETRL